ALVVLGQNADALIQQFADKRIELEYLAFLVRSQQIDNAEYTNRVNKTNADIQNLRVQLAKLPRDQQVRVNQEQQSLFQVKVVPLREQWAKETKERLDAARAAAQSRDDEIRKQLPADADVAGKLQADRVLLKERVQRGEVSQADFAKRDADAEQQV